MAKGTAAVVNVTQEAAISTHRQRLAEVIARCQEIDVELGRHFQATSPYAIHDGPNAVSPAERHRLAALAPALRAERHALQSEFEGLVERIRVHEGIERARKLAAARARLRPEAREIDRLLTEVRDRSRALARRASEEGLPESATFAWDSYLEAPSRAWRRDWELD
jgi:hypothetical protein